MTTTRERLKKQIAEVQQRPRKQRFYGNRLKREIIDYVWQEMDEGRAQYKLAEELGLAVSLLSTWMQEAKRAQERGTIPFHRSRLDLNPEARPVLLMAYIERVHFDDIHTEAVLKMLGVSEHIPTKTGRFTPRETSSVRDADAAGEEE